jgi:hypothetical protein
MKNYKLFQICYTLNFFSCLLIVIIDAYALITNWNSKDSRVTVFIIILIVTFLFGIFDWFCHKLMHSIKTNTLLSKRMNSVGENLKNTCLVINVLFGIGLVGFIINTVLDHPLIYLNIKRYFVEYCFIGFMLMSFYLCVAYWLILKHHNINFENSIENIGETNRYS